MGPRGSLEKRGVNVGIQEDQLGRDMLNITRSLRTEPKKGDWGGVGQCTHEKRKREEEAHLPAMMD